ncbi:MAG TPA: GTPase [Candidatus Lokiarchaeia archaeon]|nr:GTPase [Candidatus Lokiarchaeia archaeon]
MGIGIPAIKIILIGPSNVGKTTLRKIFFEQESPLKLLNESLEPTRGVETTVYDMEESLAIHDLAGQQLESWFTENFDVFNETDLIIAMVDSCDEWEENKKFWERVNFQRQRICPKAHLMILFHKVDLLDDEKRQQLDWNISTTFAGEHDITAFTSSIVSNFFQATFKNFVRGLRQCIMKIKDVEVQQVFQRVEILTRFIDQTTFNLNGLITSMGFPEKIGKKILEDMYTHNYIQIDDANKTVTLGEQGLQLINSMNSVSIHAPRDIFKDIPLVKGVIFSDDRGISFFLYEYKQGFYAQLMPEGGEFPDPALISGFMSAIGGFATEIGGDAKTVNITGVNAQVLSQQYENLICIFFLEPMPTNQSLVEILAKFAQAFHIQFASQIALVAKCGSIDQFPEHAAKIEEMILNLNAEIHEQIMKQSPITGPQLISLYQKVDLAGIDPDVTRDIKQLIFHYAITQSDQDLAHIESLLGQYNIQ